MKPAGADSQGVERYVFDGFEVDVVAHTLTRDGDAASLEPKAFAVLTALLRRPGELLGRDELLDGIWGHRHVTPGVLTRAIAQLRSALGDDPQRPRYIQTQHALGYRFVGELRGKSVPGAPAPVVGQSPGLEQPIDAEAAVALPTQEPGLHAGARQWWLASLLVVLAIAASWSWNRYFRSTPPPAGTSIAVLPFASISNDPADAYFAEGLAVEMHDALAGLEGLTLAAQMSPEDSRRDQDVKVLGSTLGVDNVLQASVRRQGRRVRISAQLSDTSTGYSVWSNTYDRELADIFATQAEIAGEVAGALVDVLPAQREAMARRLRPTTSLAAFDLYLRGLDAMQVDTADGSTAGAIEWFRRALSVDSGFARAQAGICRAEITNFRNRNDAEAFGRARQSCERARQMEPEDGQVSLALAELHQSQGDHGRAAEYFRKAEEYGPTRSAAHVGQAIMHADLGNDSLSSEYFDRALALQPRNPHIHSQVAYRHYLAGRFQASIASYRKALELLPGDKVLWSYLGGVHLTVGQPVEAEKALLRSLAIGPTYSALTNLGEIRYLSGRHAEAVELQQRAVALDPSDHLAWGNLGQAQLADAATAARSRDSFTEAAARAESYLRINTDDAKGLAALGWYKANLGQPAGARDLVARSEKLGGEPGEVALFNAQTLALLGDHLQARERVANARAAGIIEMRIAGNAALQGLFEDARIVSPSRAQATAPSTRDGPGPGE